GDATVARSVLQLQSDSSSLRSARLAGRLSDDQFGRNGHLRRVIPDPIRDSGEQPFCGDLAHAAKRLPHCGETRREVRRPLDVIETDDRDVFGNAQPRIPERPYRTDGRDIVECYQRRKRFTRSQEIPRIFVSLLGYGWTGKRRPFLQLQG